MESKGKQDEHDEPSYRRGNGKWSDGANKLREDHEVKRQSVIRKMTAKKAVSEARHGTGPTFDQRAEEMEIRKDPERDSYDHRISQRSRHDDPLLDRIRRRMLRKASGPNPLLSSIRNASEVRTRNLGNHRVALGKNIAQRDSDPNATWRSDGVLRNSHLNNIDSFLPPMDQEVALREHALRMDRKFRKKGGRITKKKAQEK